MKLKLLILYLLLSVSHLFAQEIEQPDYRQIRQVTNNMKSPNYYPRLLEMYLQCDTTLTLLQYRYLYYGFALQEDFVPYMNEKPALWSVRSHLVQSKGAKDVCPEAIRIAKEALADNPFDLPAMATLSISYLQLGDSTEYRKWDDLQTAILDAIVSSGDGETIETAIHVLSIEHEYEVCARLGLEVAQDSLCDAHTEYIKVKPNAENIEGLYFNFGACVEAWKKRWE